MRSKPWISLTEGGGVWSKGATKRVQVINQLCLGSLRSEAARTFAFMFNSCYSYADFIDA